MPTTIDAWLVDTNVLLPWANADFPTHSLAFAAVQHIVSNGGTPCAAAQNLIEFWNVATRPADRNGFGFTPERADPALRRVEEYFQRLPESDAVYPEWKRLVLEHRVSGVQVHDARLAAFMRVHDIAHILTFNTRDFRRYPFIEAVDPRELG